jgi:hypothetical protein
MERWHRNRTGPARERGAVAVEAALVVPLLLAVLFGIVEVSLLIRDHVAVSSAVRVGSRIASASADAGPGVCHPAEPEAPPCTPDRSPALAQAAADAIQRAGSAMPRDSIEHILIYEANAQGFPGGDGNTTMPASCAGFANCVKFVWKESDNAFRYAGGGWDSKGINACANRSDADTQGVSMRARHQGVTGIFGASIGLSDRSVMRFEPLPNDSCSPDSLYPHA